MTPAFHSIVVVGAGAVGSYFGGLLALAGHAVTLVGRAPHVQAIRAQGLQVHRAGRVDTVSVVATTDLAAVRGADLVLLCVKSPDTDAVARQLAPLLGEHTVVLGLQNGVDNVATLRRHLRQVVVPAAVYVATTMPAPGQVQHLGRGDLVIGPPDAAAAHDPACRDALHALVDLFATAQVPVTVSDDVMGDLWRKLLVNCAYNAVSALVQAPYGRMAALPAIRELQRDVVREVVAVAAAEGIALSLDAAQAAVDQLAQAMPAQFSSTAQDLARGRATEIDHLNGHVVRRGAAHGIATPVNRALWALVKLAEAGQGAAPPG